VKTKPFQSRVFAALLAGGVLFSAGAALAHHSYAAFDRARTVQLTGTVKAWEWTNPHVWLTVTVAGKSGPETWAFEGMAPATLRAKGWSRTMMKPGDKILVVSNPRRDGTKGGALVGVTLPSGQAFGGENPAAGL
jgi:hypothetical protein